MADKRVILSDPLTQDRLFPAVIADNIFNADGTPFDLEGLKTSVSEGKALVAAAVTGKGVVTAADATFETIANNINSIKVGYDVVSFTYNHSGQSSSHAFSQLIGKSNAMCYTVRRSSSYDDVFCRFLISAGSGNCYIYSRMIGEVYLNSDTGVISISEDTQVSLFNEYHRYYIVGW